MTATRNFCRRCSEIGEQCDGCYESEANAACDGYVPDTWGTPVTTKADWDRETGNDEDDGD